MEHTNGDHSPVLDKWSANELVTHCLVRPPDEFAWSEFVRRYHQTIRGTVLKTYRLKAVSEIDRKAQLGDQLVDDLVQAIYAKLLDDNSKALRSYRGEHDNSIYKFLNLISANVVRDHFRELMAQKRPRISHSLDELMESTGDRAVSDETASLWEDANDPENSSLWQEIERVLPRVTSRRNRDRDVLMFKLHYLDGLTCEEIVKTMNLDISAIGVNSIINRIVKKLRGIVLRNRNHQG